MKLTEENDPFKNAMMFWKMCPHHYTNEDLYQAFKARLKDEATLNLWPKETTPLDCRGIIGDIGKTDANNTKGEE